MSSADSIVFNWNCFGVGVGIPGNGKPKNIIYIASLAFYLCVQFGSTPSFVDLLYIFYMLSFSFFLFSYPLLFSYRLT